MASLDTTASNATVTPREDLDLAPVCWISARSSCTPSDVRKLICLELPVAPEAVQIELELLVGDRHLEREIGEREARRRRQRVT